MAERTRRTDPQNRYRDRVAPQTEEAFGLSNVRGFERPMASGPNDTFVGEDELGNQIYRTLLGTEYKIRPATPDESKTTRSHVEDWMGEGMPLPSMETVGEVAKALPGMVYESMQDTLQGTATMGEAVGWAPGMQAAGAGAKVPAGALRMGGGPAYEKIITTPDFSDWSEGKVVKDTSGKPLVLFRGAYGDTESVSGSQTLQPRSGYAVFGSDNPAVASTYANLDPTGFLENEQTRGAVTPFFVKADEIIEFPVRERDGYRSFDMFEFDRRARRLKPGQVLVARGVNDQGPRGFTSLDPERKSSKPSDVYAFGEGTDARPATSFRVPEETLPSGGGRNTENPKYNPLVQPNPEAPSRESILADPEVPEAVKAQIRREIALEEATGAPAWKDTSRVEFYNPLRNGVENLEFGKNGLKGETIAAFLEKRVPKGRASLLRSLDSGKGIFKANQRYTQEEALGILDKNFGKVYAESANDWQDFQRMSFLENKELDYGEIVIRQDRDVPFKPGDDGTHYGDNALGHARFSVRDDGAGGQMLVVEELQSDLVQKGYRTELPSEAMPDETIEQAMVRRREDLKDTINANFGQPSDYGDTGEFLKPKDIDLVIGDVEEFLSKRYNLEEEATKFINKLPVSDLAKTRLLDVYDQNIEQGSNPRMSLGYAIFSAPYNLTNVDRKAASLLDAYSSALTALSDPLKPRKGKPASPGTSIPPIDSTTEFVRPLIYSLMREAKNRGVDKVVIPNSDAFLEARKGGLFHYDPNKMEEWLKKKGHPTLNDLDEDRFFRLKEQFLKETEEGVNSAFRATYDKAVDKVLRELDREMGVDVGVEKTNLRTKQQDPIDPEYGTPRGGPDPDQILSVEDQLDNLATDFQAETFFIEGFSNLTEFQQLPYETRVRLIREAQESGYEVGLPGQTPEGFVNQLANDIIESQRGPRTYREFAPLLFTPESSAPTRPTSYPSRMITINNLPEGKMRFAEGGLVEDQTQFAFMNEGGMVDDGATVEPTTGNVVPPGSLKEEVADSIDAKLSVGEYVVPADVVQYYGVAHFEKLRQKAKQGLAEMEQNGRIGGDPAEDELPFSDEELMAEDVQEDGAQGFAEGGLAAWNSPQTTGLTNTGVETVTYVGPDGSKLPILFINGQPIQQVPQGYSPEGQVKEQAAAFKSVRPTASEGSDSATLNTMNQEPKGISDWAVEDFERYANSKSVMDIATKIPALLGPGGMLLGGVVNKAYQMQGQQALKEIENRLTSTELDAQSRQRLQQAKGAIESGQKQGESLLGGGLINKLSGGNGILEKLFGGGVQTTSGSPAPAVSPAPRTTSTPSRSDSGSSSAPMTSPRPASRSAPERAASSSSAPASTNRTPSVSSEQRQSIQEANKSSGAGTFGGPSGGFAEGGFVKRRNKK